MPNEEDFFKKLNDISKNGVIKKLLTNIKSETNDYDYILEDIRREYPAISRIPLSLQRGSGEHFSETYPAWERDNPNHGVNTITVNKKGQQLDDDQLKNMVSGEVLHLLGGVDDKGTPVDPKFRDMKRKWVESLDKKQWDFEHRVHRNQVNQGKDKRSFEEWMDVSRVDQYLGAYLFPTDTAKDFQKEGVYNEKQKAIMEEMRRYLRGK